MRKAFTLIELLVVIGILSIVAAILLPVFSRVREQARRAHCMNNLKQAYLGIDAYMADYDDRYPTAYENYEAAANPNLPSLPQMLRSYVPDPKVWICPSDIGETFPDDLAGWNRVTPPLYAFQISSYNWEGKGSTHPVGGKPRRYIRKPSYYAILYEMRPWHGFKRTDKGMESPGLCNTLYADGHVTGRTWQQRHDDWNVNYH